MTPPSPAAAPNRIQIPTPLPTPLPPHLLALLLTHLETTSSTISKILTTLESACADHNWENALRARVMEILREGEVRSREELVVKIVGEARGEGSKRVEGKGVEGKGVERSKGLEGAKGMGVRVPEEGIREGTRIVKEVLEGGVVFVDEREKGKGKGFWE